MRATSWLIRFIVFLSVCTILHEEFEVGLFGIALIAIVAAVYNVCGYIEGVNSE